MQTLDSYLARESSNNRASYYKCITMSASHFLKNRMFFMQMLESHPSGENVMQLAHRAFILHAHTWRQKSWWCVLQVPFETGFQNFVFSGTQNALSYKRTAKTHKKISVFSWERCRVRSLIDSQLRPGKLETMWLIRSTVIYVRGGETATPRTKDDV